MNLIFLKKFSDSIPNFYEFHAKILQKKLRYKMLVENFGKIHKICKYINN